jgi:UDP-2,3-diacylglucosamine pyrophosphatase LpxH
MSAYLPQFDELYVVSDIHMGGERTSAKNFQIFQRGERLGALIRHVTTVRPGEQVAFLLNGDIIDSLAEDTVASYAALDARTAERMMEHIFTDVSFAPVWNALAAFVRTPQRHLVFVVGNHDIELALPVVQGAIRRRLADGNAEAQARMTFATHGGGFACKVGKAAVFCTHGNEVDPMNWVDFNGLGQLANAMNAGRAVDPAKWQPNGGTRLVVDVMNTVKARYPFVDSLKPEIAAVAAVLLALDKDLLKKIDFDATLPIGKDAIRGALVTNNLLGAGAPSIAGAPAAAVADAAVDHLLGPSFREAVRAARPPAAGARAADDLLLDADKSPGKPGHGSQPAGGASSQTLGAWDIVAGRLGMVPKPEALRRALQDWLEDDRTFDPQNPSDRLIKTMADRVADEVHFVVTGHTHKAIARPFKRGTYYYNTGTWIRLLRLTAESLKDRATFEKAVWPMLDAGKMAVLDDAQIPGPGGASVPLLFDRTNAVRISAQGTRVVGDLLRVADGATAGSIALPVALEPGTSSFVVE